MTQKQKQKQKQKQSFWYLASPYTAPTSREQAMRYLAAQEALEHLLRTREWAYSPIVHCHDLALQYELPKTFDFWMEYNKCMLDASHGVLVLAIEGWNRSRGVRVEIEYAATQGKEIRFMYKDSQSAWAFCPSQEDLPTCQ